MLRISLHASSLAQTSRFNRVAWLDLAYAKLEPVADYKVLLFEVGDGAREPRTLPQYPRWSASLWDLVARGLALALHPDEDTPQGRAGRPAGDPQGLRLYPAVVRHH